MYLSVIYLLDEVKVCKPVIRIFVGLPDSITAACTNFRLSASFVYLLRPPVPLLPHCTVRLRRKAETHTSRADTDLNRALGEDARDPVKQWTTEGGGPSDGRKRRLRSHVGKNPTSCLSW